MSHFDPRQDLKKILQKYLDGKATAEEIQFVETYYNSFEKNPDVLNEYSEAERDMLAEEMESYLLNHIEVKSRSIPIWRKSWFRAAAASILLVLAFGSAYHFRHHQPAPVAERVVPKDFTPGGDLAILTLSDGSSIVLDSEMKGDIINHDMARIKKNEEGQLVYERTGKESAEAMPAKMNMVSTPAGGQYRIVLADGSKVWLNASSSLEFPTFFSGRERRVKIMGECYFEIAKDHNKPFIVNVADKQDIIVTGTHFNINSYKDESEIRTTLLEGSVQVRPNQISSVKSHSKFVTLIPGEQSSMSENGHFDVKNVATDEVVAWKNGLFQFQKTSLEMVMRQIARWYNVEVTYEKNIPVKTFSGKIHRDANASQILEILRFAGVNFRIEGTEKVGKSGRIVVMP